MRFNLQKFIGVFLFIVGIVIILNSFTGITGYVVYSNVGKGVGSLLGLAFVVGGILMLQVNLEQRLFAGALRKVKKTNSNENEWEQRKKASEMKDRYKEQKRRGIIRTPPRSRPLKLVEESILPPRSIKEQIKEIIKNYQAHKIDEVDVADELNSIGELTGGAYKPQTRLSVQIQGASNNLPGVEGDKDLAIEIYHRIITNDPAYDANCEFHFGPHSSTKHHRKGIP